MKNKFKLFSLVLMCLSLIFCVSINAAAQSVSLAWDANTEPDIAGYRLYYSTTSGQYTTNKMIEVLGINTTQATVALIRLTSGRTNFFVCTAFNTSGQESDYSNEVAYYVPAGTVYTLDATYSAQGLTLNVNSGIISGNVTTLPADAKSVNWAKSGLNVSPGQLINVDGRMYFGGINCPISLYLVDNATGMWLSSEKVIYLDNSYKRYLGDIIVYSASSNAKLYVACGHRVGLYQFQRITVSVNTPANPPVTDLYLRQLLPAQLYGPFSAEWAWNPVPGSEGYLVRIADTRDKLEKADEIDWLDKISLPAGQTTYRRDIDPTLYYGVYIAVSSLRGNLESVPYVSWYMPGDIFKNADVNGPPLCFQGGVDLEDLNYLYTSYTNRVAKKLVPPLTPGQPATENERADTDNNGIVGPIRDYSLGRAQSGKKMK